MTIVPTEIERRLQVMPDSGEPECRTDSLPQAQVDIARRAFEQCLAALSADLPEYLFASVDVRLAGIGGASTETEITEDWETGCSAILSSGEFSPRLRLDIGRKFGSAALESILGAPPETAGADREGLTDLDVHVLQETIRAIAGAFCKAWMAVVGRPLEISSLDLSQSVAPSLWDEDSVVSLTAAIGIRGVEGGIRLFVPKLLLRIAGAGEDGCAAEVQRQELLEALDRCSVEIEAVLDGARILFRDAVGLQPGRIVELPHRADTEIECRVNDVSVLRGELISNGKSLGFQLHS